MPFKDREAQREYQRRWIAARRDAWFDGRVCVDCGTSDSLELDHVDAASRVSHRIWSWAPARRDAELAKCVARCRPCHVAKTTVSLEKPQGSRNGQAKLNEYDVREIRRRVAAGEAKRALAREFGVDERAVRALVRGQTWKGVD